MEQGYKGQGEQQDESAGCGHDSVCVDEVSARVDEAGQLQRC